MTLAATKILVRLLAQQWRSGSAFYRYPPVFNIAFQNGFKIAGRMVDDYTFTNNIQWRVKVFKRSFDDDFDEILVTTFVSTYEMLIS
jgi:hypothetical protein